MNLVQETGEVGLSGVALSLWRKEGSSFIDTGFRTTTDSQGNYRFGTELKLVPGTYQFERRSRWATLALEPFRLDRWSWNRRPNRGWHYGYLDRDQYPKRRSTCD